MWCNFIVVWKTSTYQKLGWLCLPVCSLFPRQVSLDVGFGSTCVLFSLVVLGLPCICLFGAGFNLNSLVMLGCQTPYDYYFLTSYL